MIGITNADSDKRSYTDGNQILEVVRYYACNPQVQISFTKAVKNFFRTPGALDFFNTENGIELYQKKEAISFGAGCVPVDYVLWGENLLNSIGDIFLTPEGRNFLTTPMGIRFLNGNMSKWLFTDKGYEFMLSSFGEKFKQSCGEDWQSKFLEYFARTDIYCWLFCNDGRDFLRSEFGKDFLMSPCGKKFLENTTHGVMRKSILGMLYNYETFVDYLATRSEIIQKFLPADKLATIWSLGKEKYESMSFYDYDCDELNRKQIVLDYVIQKHFPHLHANRDQCEDFNVYEDV